MDDNVKQESVKEIAELLKEPLARWFIPLLVCHALAKPQVDAISERLARTVEKKVEEISSEDARAIAEAANWQELVALLTEGLKK